EPEGVATNRWDVCRSDPHAEHQPDHGVPAQVARVHHERGDPDGMSDGPKPNVLQAAAIVAALMLGIIGASVFLATDRASTKTVDTMSRVSDAGLGGP